MGWDRYGTKCRPYATATQEVRTASTQEETITRSSTLSSSDIIFAISDLLPPNPPSKKERTST
ncbi:unnamed protein product [Absidia cylindrospora]